MQSSVATTGYYPITISVAVFDVLSQQAFKDIIITMVIASFTC